MSKLSTFKAHFPELWNKLHSNQRKFVIERHKYTSDKECAEAIGIKPNTVYRWPAYVGRAVEAYYDNIVWIAEKTLSDSVARAALIKAEALYDEEDKDRMDKAASEVLDRALGRATQKIEGKISSEMKVIGLGINPDDV